MIRGRVWSSVALVLVGCSAFDAAETSSPGDGGPDDATETDGAPPTASADGGADSSRADARSDAAACAQETPPNGLECGNATCGRGERCCLPDLRCFLEAQSPCGSTQLNCTSAADCPSGQRCCAKGPLGGTHCLPNCEEGTPVVCRSPSECGMGEICARPEDPQKQPWWSCEPCPR